VALSDTRPKRVDGYAPLRDYAAIGDGRTVALVARDGSIDWLPVPDLDSGAVFAAVLDRVRGGRFELAPSIPYEVTRRYLAGTNVLETSFSTAEGDVKVTDVMTLPDSGLHPVRELQRRVEALSGRVPMRWQFVPRFGYGQSRSRLAQRDGHPVVSSGDDAVALCLFEAGAPEYNHDGCQGAFVAAEGSPAALVLSFAHQEPLVLPARRDVDRRFAETCVGWRRWSARRTYSGAWPDAVVRSALVLKLLVFAPSGAVAAAATTSLPEELGGVRNWDYRFSWIRDSAFTIDAFLQLGCPTEARAYFWWLMHATQLTSPELRVLYRLDGGIRTRERPLPLSGYRDSRPVNVGNAAATQLQLDTYGELMQTAWLYEAAGQAIDADIGARLGRFADHVCAIWHRPDSGIWEVRSEPVHFTQSKMMCAVALDRACELAERHVLPRRHLRRWRDEAAAIRDFVETRCWSESRQSYARYAGGDELDASLLLAVLHHYRQPRDGRLLATIAAIADELTDGPFVQRYTGEDGVRGSEGAFLACSFWLAEALARGGRVDQAVDLFETLLSLANDVGLYSEEIDPVSGEFLGNMPQGLSHLALINTAAALAEATQ
jgi:GH15 family glucan-1,4-alpha-glucosidase